jgi:hypothetical protein
MKKRGMIRMNTLKVHFELTSFTSLSGNVTKRELPNAIGERSNTGNMARCNKPDYTAVKIQGKFIYIIDFSIIARPYNVKKYIKKFLRLIPKGDLEELGAIVLYDDSERVFDRPLGTVAGNYSKPDGSEEAKIYIYLNWALGVYPFFPRPTGRHVWNILRNRFFISLFGKAYLAEIFFHEIGHHHCMTLLKKEYVNDDDAESDAKEYGNSLYEKSFPRAMHLYQLFHYLVFQVVYKKDVSSIPNLRDQYLAQRGL